MTSSWSQLPNAPPHICRALCDKMADLNNVERTDLKKKKGSKKNKKDWRKKTNVEDVEEHLEDVRRQERTG